jgi:hypothetical protein
MSPQHDVARVRFDNAMHLFDEFVQATIKSPDAATLRGLERRFAERLQIQPSYWSQIKSRSRQIGERLARQFEQLCRKPVGWMDLPHDGADAEPARSAAGAAASGTQAGVESGGAARSPSQPQDDDERFIVGLVLTYYRRHPQRARTRLLDLLGEVLTPPAPSSALAAPAPAGPASAPHRAASGQRKPPPMAETLAHDLALWARSQAGVAPLKRKP